VGPRIQRTWSKDGILPWTKEQRKVWLKTDAGRAYRTKAALARIRRHQEFVRKIKIERGCVDCGYNAHHIALDFDHKDPTEKRFSISQKMQKSKAQLLIEIDKCVVRCANCHRIKTWESHEHNSIISEDF
jgi:hypothetical protein